MNNKNFFLFTWNNNIIRNIIRNTNCAIIGATRFNNQVFERLSFFQFINVSGGFQWPIDMDVLNSYVIIHFRVLSGTHTQRSL